MRAFNQMQPSKTFSLCAGLAALNPKNTALFVSGALAIAAETYAPASQFIAMIGFVAVSSVGLALPLVLSLALGARRTPPGTVEQLYGEIQHDTISFCPRDPWRYCF